MERHTMGMIIRCFGCNIRKLQHIISLNTLSLSCLDLFFTTMWFGSKRIIQNLFANISRDINYVCCGFCKKLHILGVQ